MKMMKMAYDQTNFYLKLQLLAKRAKNFNYLFLDKKPKFIKDHIRLKRLKKRSNTITSK